MIMWITVGILAAFLVGYITGKHHGWELGYREAEAAAPLKIRQQSLAEGKCLICNDFLTKASNYEKISRGWDTL